MGIVPKDLNTLGAETKIKPKKQKRGVKQRGLNG